MSAPPSGSAGSPVPGYYPDPSIPNYIRYWNGSAWVPGTSRPAPIAADPPARTVLPPPVVADPPVRTASAEPVADSPVRGDAPVRAVPPAPVPRDRPRQAAVDESGPMFLDEDPGAPHAEPGPSQAAAPRAGADGDFAVAGHDAADPRAAWPDVTPPAARLPRITWGQPGARPATESAAPTPPQAPARSGPDAGRGRHASPRPEGGAAASSAPAPRPAVPAQDAARPAPAPEAAAAPVRPAPVPPAPPSRRTPEQRVPERPPSDQRQPEQGAEGAAGDWAAQVRQLARAEGSGPWRPVAPDPFGAARELDRPGGLVRRFVARVVDSVLLLAVTGVAAVPLGTAAYRHAQDKLDQARMTGETVTVWLLDRTTGADLAAIVGVLLVAGLLLDVLPTAKWGRTPGKKLAGLRVLDIEGRLPPRFGASLRRWLTRLLLDLTVVGLLGTAWCLIDRPWKQGLHDKAARTFVAGK